MAVEVVVLGIKVDRHLLSASNVGSDLDGEVRVVFAGKHYVGQFIQCLGDSRCVVLPDTENKSLPDFPGERITKSVLQEGFAEDAIRFIGEELLLEVPPEKGLLDQFPVFVLLHDRIAFFGE
ncbi:MAG TPA: hypothetical protein DCP63_03705 [Bacteroidetes bacterium]|nr:hypothetical protein [Bacteroidota bacterium]